MNAEGIKSLQDAATAEFNRLQSEGTELRSKVEQIETRLTQLQGKYEVLEELKQKLVEEVEKVGDVVKEEVAKEARSGK